jgi:leucyl aminopeptidase (aminopeptidase T)
MPTETALEELIPGARNAVETCLAIQPGERVTLITDRPSEEVAASLARAIQMRGASCEEFLLEISLLVRSRAHETCPRFARTPMPESMHESDAGGWSARKDIVGVVERRQFATPTWSALPRNHAARHARTTLSAASAKNSSTGCTKPAP